MTDSKTYTFKTFLSSLFVLSPWVLNSISFIILIALILLSLSVGVADFSWQGFWRELFGLATHAGQLLHQHEAGAQVADIALTDTQLLWISRLPRTIAIILTGAALSVAGIILQVVLKNRFVEPSMIGATQSSALGLLLISLYFPSSSLMAKMVVAVICAIIGMICFMRLIRPLPPSDYLLLPLVGIVFSGIIESISTFIAYQTESLQMLSVWHLGDFSTILLGRYELLYITAVLTVIAYFLADQLTIVGLGDAITVNLGINRNLMVGFVIAMVAMISSVVVVTVGAIPFVGLIIPNIISQMMGDRLRRALPAVALMGAGFVLLCDLIGRVINYPFEVPVATVFGVAGAAIFLWLLLRKPNQS
ncbi:ABC transporter permease [Neisseria montereyensis]|uniref:Iron chelate uptake ABC transporter family permease subunit n=1 Tax=Neisseria montereyensis TaxID=2973938 RepID=A0ABT2FCU1_9NEIS|nr:iron chelate uptake ABC transporter family permease subunit [Neisseria montereyensis]MCS4533370.1 iron chelate uptake ABC transporter family permease subunit [Neisseria montereyensis]